MQGTGGNRHRHKKYIHTKRERQESRTPVTEQAYSVTGVFIFTAEMQFKKRKKVEKPQIAKIVAEKP
jgi:hypothetical protein